MKLIGQTFAGLETGNAWDLRSSEFPHTNWIVGSFPTIPNNSLRHMRQSDADAGIKGDLAIDVAVKWFLHSPKEPAEWGHRKPTSSGRTMAILVGEGEFEITFSKDGRRTIVVLNTTGDFAVWGSGIEHSWKALSESPILSIRWNPT